MTATMNEKTFASWKENYDKSRQNIMEIQKPRIAKAILRKKNGAGEINLSDPGIELGSPALQVDSLPIELKDPK